MGGSPSANTLNEAESSSLTLRPASRLGLSTLTHFRQQNANFATF
jgi:hypothetical protein